MSNTFIVNSTLDMMEDVNMRESWVPQSKNTFKFADLLVSPTEMKFDVSVLKMSFRQRMRFLSALSKLQEYYSVKKFRDSISKALPPDVTEARVGQVYARFAGEF